MATTTMISKAVGGNARIGMLVEKQHHPIHASSWVFSSCGLQHSATPPAFKRNSLSLQKHQHVNLGRRSVVTMAAQWENVMPLPMDNNVASLESLLDASSSSTTPAHPNQQSPRSEKEKEERNQNIEALIERMIFDCRFLTIMAVVGSLAGSLLCFLKGSLFVVESFVEYFQASWQGLGTSQVIFLLVEAVDVYLMGTVMLIFGMGLYELFVSTLEVAGEAGEACEVQGPACGSNLFGLFRLTERPKWLEIRSLDELKTKLGHVIVMILLVGMFEKSKKVPINTGLDLLCFSASILLSSGCLYLLSKLHTDEHK